MDTSMDKINFHKGTSMLNTVLSVHTTLYTQVEFETERNQKN